MAYDKCTEFHVIWRKIYLGKRTKGDSGFTVAHASVAPVRLWSQNRVCDVLMMSVRCQGGQFPMRRESTKSARRGRAFAPRPNFCLGPRTPILKKNTWNFLHYFSSALFFFMNAAPNYVFWSGNFDCGVDPFFWVEKRVITLGPRHSDVGYFVVGNPVYVWLIFWTK